MNHEHWMQRCLDLAMLGAGFVSPNPLVGSVITGPDGALLGEGFHARYGGPHAEVVALDEAEKRVFGDRFSDSTLFVNLEPCSHHGKTPPCTDLILKKGIPRVVVAMQDPNPEVAGRGIQRLRDAGVDVEVGVLGKEAKRLNEAFTKHITTGRPLVTLKVAQTLDGRVASADGKPTTISSLESRTLVHRWRSELDAVLVGAGTARADDPQLTVRLVEGRQPIRVVLDRTGRLPLSLRLFSDDHVSNTVAIVAEDATSTYEAILLAAGGRVIRAPTRNSHLDLSAAFKLLGVGEGLERAIQSVLVEAGPGLATALLQNDLVDRLFLFTAPYLLGNGAPAFLPWNTEPLWFAEVGSERLGDDALFRGYLRAV